MHFEVRFLVFRLLACAVPGQVSSAGSGEQCRFGWAVPAAEPQRGGNAGGSKQEASPPERDQLFIPQSVYFVPKSRLAATPVSASSTGDKFFLLTSTKRRILHLKKNFKIWVFSVGLKILMWSGTSPTFPAKFFPVAKFYMKSQLLVLLKKRRRILAYFESF